MKLRRAPFFSILLALAMSGAPEQALSQSKTGNAVPTIDLRHPALIYIGDLYPKLFFGIRRENEPCDNVSEARIIDRRTESDIIRADLTCDGLLTYFGRGFHRDETAEALVEALESGNAMYSFRTGSCQYNCYPNSISGWKPLIVDKVSILRMSESEFAALQAKNGPKLASAVRATSSDDIAVRDIAVQSLRFAPQFAAGRAVGLVKASQNTVTLDMVASQYDFDVETRNTKCSSIKAGKSCSYDMNIGIALSFLSNQVFRIQTGWQKRQDVFSTVGGRLKSATLDKYTHQIASSIGDNGGSRPSTDDGWADREKKRVDCITHAVQNSYAPIC